MAEGKYKKLLSNTAIYGVGTFASKILVFLLTRLYTECLTTEQFGTADLITNTANLLIPFAAAGVCEAIFRFALDSKEDKRSVLSTGFFLICITSAVFAAVAAVCGALGVFVDYLWLVAIYVLMSNFHSMLALYIRALDRTKLYALQGIMNTVLTISFNLLFLVILPSGNFFDGVNGYVLSVVIADAVMGLFLLIYARLYRDIRPRAFDGALAKRMLKYSIPLVPTTVFWWVTNVSDRFMVTYFCSEAANGIYTAAYKIPTLLILITGVFSEAWQFSAVKESESDDRAEFYTNVFGGFRAVIFISGAFIIAFSQIIAKILYAADFYTAWNYIPVLVGSSIFSSFVTFLSSIYMVKKKSVKSFVTAMVGALVNITLNFALIPNSLELFGLVIPCAGWGAQGAAIATMISYATVFVIRAVDTKRLMSFRLGALSLALNSAVIAVQIVTMLFVDSILILAVCQAVCVAAIVAVNTKTLLFALRSILNALRGRKKVTKKDNIAQ